MSTPTRARALTHGSPSSTRVAAPPPEDPRDRRASAFSGGVDDRAQLEATGLYGFLAECLKKEPSAELCRRLVAEEVCSSASCSSWRSTSGSR